MEVIKWSCLALLMSCSPALAECFDPDESAKKLANAGYEITFYDKSNGMVFAMAENGKGGWYFFIISDGKFCPVSAGANGVRLSMTPNA